MRAVRSLLSLLLVAAIAQGCTAGAVKTLAYAPQLIDPAVNVTDSVIKASKQITPEEEYRLGRAVAGRLLQRYQPVVNERTHGYLNLIGALLALHSPRPQTFGGYHVAQLDSPEINAFACPGGLILVTTGMIAAASSEDEIAAVLAHEIAHVSRYDGVAAVKSSRWANVAAVVGSSLAKVSSPTQVGQLVHVFDGAVEDVFQALVVRGYSRAAEYAADAAAVRLLTRAGYDPASLRSLLVKLEAAGTGSGKSLFKTHPATRERLAKLPDHAPGPAAGIANGRAARLARYRAAMAD